MSWFYLHFGTATSSVLPSLPHAEYAIQREDLFVAAGGPNATCIFHSEENGSGFVVCGAGLLEDGKRVSLMDAEDWSRWLSSPSKDVASLGGHFACVAWSSEGVEFFNDVLGMREIFFQETKDGLTVSSHQHLLTSTAPSNTLDASAFGGKWYLYMQCNHNSWIKGVKRAGPGAHGHYDLNKGLTISRRNIDLEYGSQHDDEIVQTLAETISRFTTYPIENENVATLSLSGGKDSRILLAALLHKDRDAWDSFTFGSSADVDAIMAKRLAEAFDFKHTLIGTPDIALQDVEDMIITNDLFKPASSAYANLSYKKIDRGIIVDGAAGELLRRGLQTRLELFGSKSLINRDWNDVASYFHIERSDLWSIPLTASLRKAAKDQIAQLGDSIPAAAEIGVGNWIDTVYMRYVLPNVNGTDQRRLDGIRLCTTVFAQPQILKLIFGASEQYRKGGKLHKDVLRLLHPQVSKYPYAKDEVILPHWTPWYLAKLYGKLAKKRSAVVTDQTPFLQQFKVPILDTLNSRAVKECTLYDQKRLHTNVNAYYNGEHQHAAFVDWWFSFEIWRAANRVSDFV